MQAGANDYLTKPINAAEFLKKLGKYINIPSRQNLRVLSRVKIKAQKGEREFFANTVNISNTGMLIESADAIAVGDKIKIALFLPGSFSPIDIEGVVVRKLTNDADKSPQYGVKFITIAEKDRTIIEKYVNGRRESYSKINPEG